MRSKSKTLPRTDSISSERIFSGPTILAIALIALAIAASYWNTLRMPFHFDGINSIVNNDTIRSLWPPVLRLPEMLRGQTVDGRPLLNYSFAINYAIGGTSTFGYHLTNLLLHFATAVTIFLFGKNLLTNKLFGPQTRSNAYALSLSIALLWAAHPLQTQAVTYIVQRAESLSSLFYALTMYFAAIGMDKQGKVNYWYMLSAGACFLGVLSKEIIVTAPVAVLLYDRCFMAGNFRDALQRRAAFYTALFSSWVLLIILLQGTGDQVKTALFSPGISHLEYILTQFYAVPHYIRLALFPYPLVFDYGTAPVTDPVLILPGALIVAGLAVFTVRQLIKGRPGAFAMSLFFLILSPTSTFFPLSTLISEHRFYLALAPLIAVAVVGVHHALAESERVGPLKARSLTLAFAGVFLLLFIPATIARNYDYSTNLSIWADTARKKPDNLRARLNLFNYLRENGNSSEARAELEYLVKAVELTPDDGDMNYNLGTLLATEGYLEKAIPLLRNAVRVLPLYAGASNNLAKALLDTGRAQEALPLAQQAVSLAPNDHGFANNLANVFMALGKPEEASRVYLQALEIKPDYPEAHFNLGNAYMQLGNRSTAAKHFETAIALRPDYVKARFAFGVALLELGKPQEAAAQFNAVIAVAPEFPNARRALEISLSGGR